MAITLRTTALVLFLGFSVAWASSNVRRVEISKATQAESPLEFSLTITPDAQQPEHVSVKLVLPPQQQELADLWKVFLWVVKEKKAILSVPLELAYSQDKTITIRYSGRVDIVEECLIAIRCGEHAPLSETIYQVHVGSYLK